MKEFVDAMNGTVPERRQFIAAHMTAKRQETDAEIDLTMANYARRMGRPELIDLKRDGAKLVALMRNLESQQVELLTLTLHLVTQDGATLIDDFLAQGVR